MVVTASNITSTARNTATATGGEQAVTQRTYVLDTSVLLSDPQALFRFAEHDGQHDVVFGEASSRANVTTPSWGTSPARPSACSTT